jgi:xanthine dehydrogenase accessory factor
MTLLQELAELEREGTPAVLCTLTETRGSVPQRVGSKMVVRGDGTIAGTIGGGALEHAAIQRALEVLASGTPETWSIKLGPDLGMACGGAVSVFFDPLLSAPRLILFGAGHIARDLAAMAIRVGFRVQVIDARPEWASPAAFPAETVVLAADPLTVLDQLPFGPKTYVVLVSHSHAVDQGILGGVLQREWAYLGMIASKTKVKKIFGELEAQGADPARMAQVHSPIGLRIGAVDPAEIAVSILAELVRVLRGADEDPATSFHTDE